MGNNTTQNIRTNQTVVNNVLQASKAECTAQCRNVLEGITIIVIGGSGNINITQECALTNINCIMQQSLTSQIETILKAMAAQSASAMNGFSLDFANISQNVDLYQYISNSITQLMDSSCKFEASDTISGLYMYVANRDRSQINISQRSTISNATCNMNNMAKSVTYNEASAEADQKSTIVNIWSLFFYAFIAIIASATIILIVFIATGGVATIAGAAAGAAGGAKGGAAKGGKKGAAGAAGSAAPAASTAAAGASSGPNVGAFASALGGLPSKMSAGEIAGFIARNPQLLAML